MIERREGTEDSIYNCRFHVDLFTVIAFVYLTSIDTRLHSV